MVDVIVLLYLWGTNTPKFYIRERMVHEIDIAIPMENEMIKLPLRTDPLQTPGLGRGKGELPAKRLESDVLMKRMEQSLQREARNMEGLIAKLPKPYVIMNEAEGPVSWHASGHAGLPLNRTKLVILARRHSGYPLIGQFLNSAAGWFEHWEPPGNRLHTITNLLNCVLTTDLISDFPTKSTFSKSPYFRDHCLLDSTSVCSDPLSYEHACSEHPYQVLHAVNMSLHVVHKLLKENEDLRIIYLARDPRSILLENPNLKPHRVCGQMSEDVDHALGLLGLFPQQFSLARFEVLAMAPVDEVSKLLSNLGISVQLQGNPDDTDGWRTDQNPDPKVNAWKQKLTINEINKMEGQCSETLSKLEYQLLGKAVN